MTPTICTLIVGFTSGYICSIFNTKWPSHLTPITTTSQRL